MTPATARRCAWPASPGSVGLLVLLLAVKDGLVGLVPAKLHLPGIGETIDPALGGPRRHPDPGDRPRHALLRSPARIPSSPQGLKTGDGDRLV